MIDLTRRSTGPSTLSPEAVDHLLETVRDVLLCVEDAIHQAGVAEARTQHDLNTLRTATVRQSEALAELNVTVSHVASSATQVAAAAEAGAQRAESLTMLAASGRADLSAVQEQL